MNALDYVVLLATLLGIAAYGIWRTRERRTLSTYLKGASDARWFTIGLSVMATQASAVTFLSMPGQGYQDGLGFIQNYFGAPLALIVISIFFLPVFRRLNVYTAYEYLGQRFDRKTRLLGAAVFLIQRGIGAGVTVYAPAIVLSTVFGWSLPLTIIASGVVVTAYTVTGGSEAVSLTQKYQFGVIIAGMVIAFIVLLTRLPHGLGFGEALTVAGGFHKLQAVDTSFDFTKRYTLWSGIIGGLFLQLSYFGSDQSQVQRYLGGASLRESRLGLMFNAIFKIPMQLFILLLGVLVFVFYQFERPPVFFNRPAWNQAANHGAGEKLRGLEADYTAAQAEKQQAIDRWLSARRAGDTAAAETAHTAAQAAHQRGEAARDKTKAALVENDPRAPTTDTDYVFITFILDYLPHGLIGLLVTVFFAATLNSKSAELNALASSTTVDFYRHLVRPGATDAQSVTASRWFTALWGAAAIGIALSVTLAENLIQFANIVASIFYPVVLGLFLVAFFLKRIGGTAVFCGALCAQVLVCAIFFLRFKYPVLGVAYLWYNPIGCAVCVLFAVAFQLVLGLAKKTGFNRMSAPVICFGQQPCGFFPRRFLFAKFQTARRLQREMGGEIVFFFHDSDHDCRETQTTLRHAKTGEPLTLNFTFANKLQRKFSPLYAKRVSAEWRDNTARQLPAFVGARWADLFRKISPTNAAEFCLDMYRGMGLLDGIRVERSSDPAFRRAACDITDFFVDVLHQGEIVRARQIEGVLKLHEGGDCYTTLPAAAAGKEQISPTRDSRLRWMQSVIHCTHYIAGAGEQAYLNTADAPEINFVKRDEIDRSDEAYTEITS